jgi:glycosyltransferase involved in cell wall biosynthesis
MHPWLIDLWRGVRADRGPAISPVGDAPVQPDSTPLLAVVIPVRNAARTLPKTLESLNRVPPPARSGVEIILIDDGSTDESRTILEAFAARRDFHVRVIAQGHQGAGPARNAGLHVAHARWVIFLDSDDELGADPAPHLAAADAEGYSAVIFAGELRRNERSIGRFPPPQISGATSLDALTASCPFFVNMVAFRRERVRTPFGDRFPNHEDWNFWLSNPQIFDRVKTVNEVVAIIHVHGANKTRDTTRRGQSRRGIAESHLHDPLTQLQRNNLTIQANIGGLLAGDPISSRAFLAFPCSASLFAKLLIYRTLGRRLARFDVYA